MTDADLGKSVLNVSPGNPSNPAVAALYVETGGCYFGLPNVDPWDRHRDARNYAGPYPVVAHPPCERWGRFATWWGGSLGEDGGCFAAALRSIERFGGVIEHPAGSKAWEHFGLPKPWNYEWRRDFVGWSCRVEQAHYGHPARKATWLFYIGQGAPPNLVWGAAEQRLPARRLAERGYESARRCGVVANMSSRQRQRTPIQFRDLLLSIAGRAVPPTGPSELSELPNTDAAQEPTPGST